MKVYELLAELRYSVRVKADSRESALKHVENWKDAWASSAELIGVNDVSVVSVEGAESPHDEEAERNNNEKI